MALSVGALDGDFPCAAASTPHVALGQTRNAPIVATLGRIPQEPVTQRYRYACAPGLWGEDASIDAQSSARCSGLCPMGHVCDAATSQPRVCSPGTYCPAGTSREISLPSGRCALAHFELMLGITCTRRAQHDTSRSITLVTCRGFLTLRWSNSSALSSLAQASLCPPGYYCADGSVQPTPVPDGAYEPYEGAPAPRFFCEAGYRCPAGSTNGNAHPCAPGSFSNAIASAVCQSCPPGTSQPLSGQTQCESCLPGTFSSYAKHRFERHRP